MIKSEEYNKNLKVCNVTSKIIKETKGCLNDAEIKELTNVFIAYGLTDISFETRIFNDCNDFNTSIKFENFDYNARENCCSEYIQRLVKLDNFENEEKEIRVVFSQRYSDNLTTHECVGIGDEPSFDPTKKHAILLAFDDDLQDDYGEIQYKLFIYNPSNNQEWNYTESQKAILEMLGREM